MSRIVVTALPAPDGVPVDQAWLHPALPDSPAVAQGDLRVAEIHVRPLSRPGPRSPCATAQLERSA